MNVNLSVCEFIVVDTNSDGIPTSPTGRIQELTNCVVRAKYVRVKGNRNRGMTGTNKTTHNIVKEKEMTVYHDT